MRSLRVFITGTVVMLAGLVMPSCKDLATEPEIRTKIAAVQITPSSVMLVGAGASTQLVAAAHASDGSTLAGSTFGWSTSSPGVALVTEFGLVTAVGPGTATITAATEGKSGTAAITVAAKPVASVAISPPTATVVMGANVQLTAEARDGEGEALEGRSIGWSSSDPAVASVDQSGVVTGLAAGSATVRAISEEVAGEAQVTVVPWPVAAVEISPAAATVQVGASTQLVAKARGADGSELPGRPVSWSSANAGIASVDATGKVTGVSAGSVAITATSEGKSASSAVTVVPAVVFVPVATVQVTPATATIQVGGEAQLSAELQDAGGNELTGRPIGWSSSDPAAAAVDITGKVTGLAPGTVTMTATSEGKTGSAVITVVPVPVASVVVTPASSTVQQGQAVKLTAQGLNGSGSPIDGKTFTWSTSDGDKATVDATGKVTGVGVGTAIITATSDGKSGAATVTVVPTPVASVVVVPATGTVVVGKTLSLTAQALDGTGIPIPGKAFTWSTDNSATATVDAAGKVSGVAPGTATVTAMTDGKTGTATVTVLPAPSGNIIGCGDLIMETISLAAEVDQYTYSGQAGNSVLLTLSQATGWPSYTTPVVTLLAPSGTVVETVNANGQKTITLPESGTYVLYVRANNLVTKGSYALGLECLDPLGPTEGALTSGSLLSGSIDGAAEVDLYTYTGTSGGSILLTLSQAAGWPSYTTPVVTLLSPSGTVVETVNANGQKTITLPESGTYVLYVRANNLVTKGSYALGLECLDPLGPTEGALTSGSLLSGSIDGAAEVDLYTYTGTGGGSILLTLSQAAGWPSYTTPVVTLLSPSGTVVETVNANGQKTITLPESGTYVLYVRANNLVTKGSYALGLESLDPLGPTEGALTSGSLLSGSIDGAAEVDLYTYAGTSGGSILLTLSQAAGWPSYTTPVVTLLSPSGTVVETVNANGQKTIALPESGTYVLYVRANNLVTKGSYNMGIQ